MAEVYSDHFGTVFSARAVGSFLAKHGAGEMHSMKKLARLVVPNAIDIGTTGDKIVLMDFKSGDRLYDILLTTDGNFGVTATFDIGLYVAGDPLLGAVVDADLWASALDITGVLDRADQWKESSTLDEVDRGKTLWELAAIGAADYTVDPYLDFSLVLTATGDTSAMAAEAFLECEVNWAKTV